MESLKSTLKTNEKLNSKSAFKLQKSRNREFSQNK